MSRPLSRNRNEIKTRVPDELYVVIRHMVETQGISESLAMCRLAMSGAFGMCGSLPPEFDDVRPQMPARGPLARI